MAANAGAGSGRRTMALSSSLDQQQQALQLQSQSQDRRSSAANFDQVASQLISQFNQQQQIRRNSSSSLAAGYQQTAASEVLENYYFRQQQQQSADQQQQAVITANQIQARQKNRPNVVAGQQAQQSQSAAMMRYGSQQQQLRASSSVSQSNERQQMVAATMGHIKDDIDIVFNRLMALEEFRKLPSSVIRNLCSCAFIERIDKGVIVFCQGDDAINWYVLLEGSVDVKVSQNGQKDGVTLCTLGAGQTFGASAAPGKAHAVSVVTSDECILLRVRRADFQEFFSEQSHLINNVETSPFCSFTSLNRNNQAAQAGERRSNAAHHQQQQPVANQSYLVSSHRNSISQPPALSQTKPDSIRQQRQADPSQQAAPGLGKVNGLQQRAQQLAPDDAKQQRDGEEDQELGELNLDSIESGELCNHLMRIGWVLRTLMIGQNPEMIQNRRIQPSQFAHHKHHHQQHHQQHQAKVGQHHKPLVSAGSSSQLLSGSAGKSASSLTAGRKVANYVAASFMRSNNKQVGGSAAQVNVKGLSGALFTSNSFDANQVSSQARLERLAQPQGELVLFRRCMVGCEMVDWLLNLSQLNSTNAARFVSSRIQAVSMWQVLLEQGVVFAYSPSESAQPAAAEVGAEPESSMSSSGSGSGNQRATANCCQFQFSDDQQVHYKFCLDADEPAAASQQAAEEAPRPLQVNQADLSLANDSLWWSLKILSKLAPDASFRLILSKRPHERSVEEVDMVFEELQHLKALSHLTNSVKKELAACVRSEHHAKQNTVIFNQGDVGQSWYIILRGSVNVVIVGKGVVCTLHEGDDFGKLALVNDAPRAATIITNEPNCYFLRVDKQNFDTILRDVEANTVRLKEHGKEVLILQKVAAKEPSQNAASQQQQLSADQTAGQLPVLASDQVVANAIGRQQQQPLGQSVGGREAVSNQPGLGPEALKQQQAASAQPTSTGGTALKYMVMAGTSEKMLEHLLETRIDGHTQIGPLLTGKSELIQHDQVSGYLHCHGDNFLEDFILTHKIFMPTTSLCNELLKQYQCQTKSQLSSAQKQSLASDDKSSNSLGEHGKLDDDYLVAKKRRVVKFIRCWLLITREHFFQQQQIQSFLTTIHQKVKHDAARFNSLQPELKAVARILELHLEDDLENRHKGVQRWIDDIYGNLLPIRRHTGAWELSQQAHSSQQQQEVFLAGLHQRRFEHRLSTIQADDEVVFRVYCADHSFATIKARVDEKASEIKLMAARKLGLEDKELILVHVKSNGERIIYNDLECNISTSLSVNGRVFVCPLDHIDAVSPLPEQDPFQEVYQSLQVQQEGGLVQQPVTSSTEASIAGGPENPPTQLHQQQQQQQQLALQNHQLNSTSAPGEPPPSANQAQGPISSHLLTVTPTNYLDIKTHMSLSVSRLEEFSSRDIAYCLTHLAWSLLKNMHEFELIYTVFGRHNFKQITANLNVFLRHFNEIQYWVVTQICLSTSLSKRVQILRKFIKIAAHCKEMQNLNAFFAITMGLSNMAVARLTQTWERLPSKLKRTFSQFESLIDPSRNQRRYRIFISKMEPPIIPFMPLFLKDMTFAHEGNKTYLENGLINFEKMQMVAQSLRTIRYCKSRPMKLDPSACKFKGSIRRIELFFRDLKIIDNQRTLTQMSLQLEHRKK